MDVNFFIVENHNVSEYMLTPSSGEWFTGLLTYLHLEILRALSD